MRKDFFLFTLMVFFLASCQKEIYFPEEVPVVPVVEKVVSAIVVTNDAQNEFDSIVFRWLPGKTMEVHYSKTGDSITRTYTYDGGRLAKIEDQKALYYTNGAVAHAISFQYNNSGQLIKTVTDFNTRSGIPAYYNMSGSGSVKSVTVFDTSYWGPTYNLGWANRIIYNTVSSDNYLTYDSCIFFNHATGGTSATVSDYTYDGNKNASSIRQHTYQDGQLTEWGDVAVTRDRPAPIYEGMRKKLYRNLTNWYDAGYVLQDDNYRFFTFPGNMYKRMSYSGYSSNGGPVPLQVAKSIEYENEYDKDLLLKSKVSFSLNGQGTIRYVNHIRYYYKLM
jgi:hypothetical protein